MKKIDKQNIKAEIKNLITLTRDKEKKSKKHVDISWVIKIILFAFLISFAFSFLSETIMKKANLIICIILVILFIGIGILFDIVGVSVTSSDIKVFNSMSSRKVYGSKMAVILIKNADKVSSFCCDVIGDICGIISGTAGVIVASSISSTFHTSLFSTSLLVTSIIAALTIGGKAMGKSFAINKSSIIVYEFSKSLTHFYKVK